MKNLKGYIIAIDEGHGGSDPGAVDLINETEGDYIATLEKDLNKRVGDKVINKLKALNAEVIATRKGDVTTSLSNRCYIANKSKAKLFISIHFNAGSSLANGIETFIYRNTKSNLTKKLGENLQNELINATNLTNRGLKKSGFYVLKHTAMSAALVELGFITNTQEETIIHSNEFQEKTANAIVEAIIKTLGV